MSDKMRFLNSLGPVAKIEEVSPPRQIAVGTHIIAPSIYSFAYALACGIGTVATAGIVAFGDKSYWIYTPFTGGFAFAGLIALVVLQNRLSHYQDDLVIRGIEYQPWANDEEESAQPEPMAETDTLSFVVVGTTLGIAHIYQPSPGAFAAWLREVIAGNSPGFSQNESVRRGWPRTLTDAQARLLGGDKGEFLLYRNLIAQLRHIGWIHATNTKNQIPEITDACRRDGLAWLSANGGV